MPWQNDKVAGKTSSRSILLAASFLALLPCAVLESAAAAEIAFLGPRGTFSEQAAESYRTALSGSNRIISLESITAVVESVRAHKTERGIIPVASTVAGFPAESAQLLLSGLDPGFRVVAELVVPVELNVLVKPGTRRELIRGIASHPNALKEAGEFLRQRYPGIPLQPVSSTAAAAEAVAKCDGSVAAVANLAAAKVYGLEILDKSIQDRENATSFWAIEPANEWTAAPLVNRLVVSLEADAGSGAFTEAITNLKKAGFAMVFVNSTPLPGKLYGFRYVISLAATEAVKQEKISAAMADGRMAGGRLKILGAFRQ